MTSQAPEGQQVPERLPPSRASGTAPPPAAHASPSSDTRQRAGHTPPASTRELGARFLADSPLQAMRVPSAIVAGGWCYVLHPAHGRFGELTLGPAEPFGFDPRMAQ